MQKELSEKFICSAKRGSFTQSEYWQAVKSGWESERIILKDKSGSITADMLVLIKRIPFFNTALMYSPRGPVCDFENMQVLRELMSEIKKLQKRHNAFMLKLDPAIEDNEKALIDNLISLGFNYAGDKAGYKNIQCRENYILELSGKTQEEVFKAFKPKYRYNIRLAIRKGVTCGSYGAEKVDEFFALLKETAKRDNFKIRQKDYYIKMLNAFGEHCRLYMCHLGNIPLSGAITVNYAGKVHYIYGASSSSYRDYMPNYLMQWEMIKWAVETGCDIYSFEGVPYYYDEKHPNYGVYRFKKGFNGRVLNLAGEFDYIFKPSVRFAVNAFFRLTGRKLL